MKTYQETLEHAGLSGAQAEVYSALLTHGKQTAGALTKRVEIKRGLVYKVLEDLMALGLVEKEGEGNEVTQFFPRHPSLLLDMVEKKTRELKSAEVSLGGVLPILVSRFNLSSGGPGIRIYEGEEAVVKTMEDSLLAKNIIRSYVDVEAVEKNLKERNAQYMKKRERLQVAKRLLVVDNPFTRELYAKEKSLITDVRFIPRGGVLCEVAMQIYDGKVSYLTLLPKVAIGVVIEDPRIFQMHAFLFDALYEKAEKP